MELVASYQLLGKRLLDGEIVLALDAGQVGTWIAPLPTLTKVDS